MDLFNLLRFRAELTTKDPNTVIHGETVSECEGHRIYISYLHTRLQFPIFKMRIKEDKLPLLDNFNVIFTTDSCKLDVMITFAQAKGKIAEGSSISS